MRTNEEDSFGKGPQKHSILIIIQNIVKSKEFDSIITAAILLQAIVLALEATPIIFSTGGGFTIDYRSQLSQTFLVIHQSVIVIFVIEIGMRIAALYPKPEKFFQDGWNNLDFVIIILSLLPITGSFSAIGRVVRLLRVTRLVTKSTELRVLVSTLVRSIPSIFNILVLLGMIFFIYAIIGYHLFRAADPTHWSSFPTSLMTLFQIITLEGWANIMQPIISELGTIYWLYFGSFILVGTFIVINLFISVIVRKSEEAYQLLQRESRIPMAQQEIAQEIREIRRILEELENRIRLSGIPKTDIDSSAGKNEGK